MSTEIPAEIRAEARQAAIESVDEIIRESFAAGVQAGREAAERCIREWAKQGWFPVYETAEEYATFFARIARGEGGDR